MLLHQSWALKKGVASQQYRNGQCMSDRLQNSRHVTKCRSHDSNLGVGNLERGAMQTGNRCILSSDEIFGSDLQGFADRVRLCNRCRERKSEFVPFVVDGDVVGFIHHRFVVHLSRFPDIFTFEPERSASNNAGASLSQHNFVVSLSKSLTMVEDRTTAVGTVLQVLNREGLVPGWRNELYPVVLRYGSSPLLAIERAAAPLFGSKAYGVHVNGYVVIGGEKHLWVAKRSETKPTFPELYDHIAAGGQAQGISCIDNVIKECDEEAAIPQVLAERAVSVGAVSYEDISGENYKRDVLFCYDIELPVDFQPYNKGSLLVATLYRVW